MDPKIGLIMRFQYILRLLKILGQSWLCFILIQLAKALRLAVDVHHPRPSNCRRPCMLWHSMPRRYSRLCRLSGSFQHQYTNEKQLVFQSKRGLYFYVSAICLIYHLIITQLYLRWSIRNSLIHILVIII